MLNKKIHVGRELSLSVFIDNLKAVEEMVGDIPVVVGLNAHVAKRIQGIATSDSDDGAMVVIGLWK